MQEHAPVLISSANSNETSIFRQAARLYAGIFTLHNEAFLTLRLSD